MILTTNHNLKNSFEHGDSVAFLFNKRLFGKERFKVDSPDYRTEWSFNNTGMNSIFTCACLIYNETENTAFETRSAQLSDRGCLAHVQYGCTHGRRFSFITGQVQVHLHYSCPSIDSWPVTLLAFSDSFELLFLSEFGFYLSEADGAKSLATDGQLKGTVKEYIVI